MRNESRWSLPKARRCESQRGRTGSDRPEAMGVQQRGNKVVYRQEELWRAGGNYGRRRVPAREAILRAALALLSELGQQNFKRGADVGGHQLCDCAGAGGRRQRPSHVAAKL